MEAWKIKEENKKTGANEIARVSAMQRPNSGQLCSNEWSINVWLVLKQSFFNSLGIPEQVRYAPKVTLRIRSGISKTTGKIVEGNELRFKCRAEANPPVLEYK